MSATPTAQADLSEVGQLGLVVLRDERSGEYVVRLSWDHDKDAPDAPAIADNLQRLAAAVSRRYRKAKLTARRGRRP